MQLTAALPKKKLAFSTLTYTWHNSLLQSLQSVFFCQPTFDCRLRLFTLVLLPLYSLNTHQIQWYLTIARTCVVSPTKTLHIGAATHLTSTPDSKLTITRTCVHSILQLVVWIYSVVVSTLDFESSDPGSSPGRSIFVKAGIMQCQVLNKMRAKRGWEAAILDLKLDTTPWQGIKRNPLLRMWGCIG